MSTTPPARGHDRSLWPSTTSMKLKRKHLKESLIKEVTSVQYIHFVIGFSSERKIPVLSKAAPLTVSGLLFSRFLETENPIHYRTSKEKNGIASFEWDFTCGFHYCRKLLA